MVLALLMLPRHQIPGRGPQKQRFLENIQPDQPLILPIDFLTNQIHKHGFVGVYQSNSARFLFKIYSYLAKVHDPVRHKRGGAIFLYFFIGNEDFAFRFKY